MTINVLCRNPHDDRVIPRFSRYLADMNGWTLTARPEPGASAYYLSGYFEWPLLERARVPDRPVGAYFTHKEEEPPGNDKAKQYDQVARRVSLRVATAALYAEPLSTLGPTVQIRPPVELDRFRIPQQRPPQLTAGFSGYTYANKRKGEDLARQLLAAPVSQQAAWLASGRGWPVKTRQYPWHEMPTFYQALDVLVVTSRVEGVPMPPLEALACGVSVVIPRGVGLLDELPDTLGIHRYERGDVAGLLAAFEEAVQARPDVERRALRSVVEPYTIANWCEQHATAFEVLLDEPPAEGAEDVCTQTLPAPTRPVNGSRGIYCVAFGEPARACAQRMMETARRHLPDIPIALCGAEPIGLEDVFIEQPDSDVGGRRAKLRAYELAPAEWQAVLYLDVDTEVISSDLRFYFDLIEDGWEFVITKDPHLHDTLHQMQHVRAGASFNLAEYEETTGQVLTAHTLMYNGGVWAFGRNERIEAFFERWQTEWEKHAQRDQPGLVRAMYTDPLKTYVLGNEWNTFHKHSRGVAPAALMHYPGRARRWEGLIPGRIDSGAAWQKVEQFRRRGGR